jgi:hypothetical protein
MTPDHQSSNDEAYSEGKEDGDPAQPGQRISMQMSLQSGSRNPPSRQRQIAHAAGEDKRQDNGQPENNQIKKSQLRPLGGVLNCGLQGYRMLARNGEKTFGENVRNE